ncbi:MAG: TonB-dependent receptor plug domain-containing protein [Sphingomonadales bacterium]|nr:TonB-dependent receptor plug domain-containing protein [Sphingomonadales bacterium]
MAHHRMILLGGMAVSLLAVATAQAQTAPAPATVQPQAAGTAPNSPGESADTGATAGDTIIVQARRRDERLQDVPLVINAVTQATLQKDNIQQFQDITTVVPGLSLVENNNGIGSSSSMRGINNDVNVSGDNGTIQYYLNDAPIDGDTIFQAMYDIDAIDVERGPQGTLRGRSTPSGSIAITTHAPDLEEAGGFVDGTIGTHDQKNVSFGIGVPIITDKLAVRVAGVYDFNRYNNVYSVNNATPPSSDTRSLRASLRFEPTDWLKMGMSFTTLNHNIVDYDQTVSFSQVDPTVPTGLAAGVVAAGPATAPNYGTFALGDRRAVETFPNNVTQRMQRFDWHVQVSFAGQNLIYVGSHENFNYYVPTNHDSGAYFPSLDFHYTTNTSNVFESHEIRLQNAERIGGILDYVVGYFRQTGQPVTSLANPALIGLVIGNFAPLPAGFAPGGLNPFLVSAGISLPQVTTKEDSFYGNVTLHIGDHNEISGGLRHIQYRDPGQNLYVNGSLISGATPNNGNPTIYNVTARHRFGEELMVYASTGTSWRPGGHAIGDFTQAAFSPNEQLFTHSDPETSTNYEIGMKSELFAHKLLVNMTYFHQDFKNYPFRTAGNGVYYIDYISPTTPAVSSFNFISGVPVKVDGVESEIDFHPNRNFSIDATIDYTRSRVGNVAIPCDNLPYSQVPTLPQLQAALPAGEHVGACPGGGLPANFQPDWSGTVTAEYDLPMGDHKFGFVRGVMPWRGATQNDPLNPYDNIGAYALLNAYIGIRNDKAGWSLMVFGKNLANLAKLETLNGSPYAVPETLVNVLNPKGPTTSANFISNYAGATVTAPREFGINFRVAFGSR